MIVRHFRRNTKFRLRVIGIELRPMRKQRVFLPLFRHNSLLLKEMGSENGSERHAIVYVHRVFDFDGLFHEQSNMVHQRLHQEGNARVAADGKNGVDCQRARTQLLYETVRENKQ